ncbi:MAG TPA: bifunctional phosphoribosyl-AMP cyclohydrolase/phosphoribosyl-ATP diphosphatase HisIE [Nitrolancea sp.]|nr:bifunctional phosphoribosyl-AMP cyclohydrolase/phosphoribosyl-ATP diphosphatase HisIE [Nitrolancea sp.]
MTNAEIDYSNLRFDSNGLIPAIVQDAASGRVRMLGYMNREALDLTVSSGRLHFWSRSRQTLWQKGETSGNVHHVLSVRTDCDGDTLLVQVRPDGPTCHLGTDSCFDGVPVAELEPLPETSRVVDEVAEVVASRKAQPVEGSYTNYLLEQGIDKIGKKIGEEAAEVIIAAKNGEPDALANEASDLIYHLLVMLEATGVSRLQVWDVLSTRRGRPLPDQPQ